MSSCRQASTPPRIHHSLSTITEEPGSWHSTTHEIVVEPELVLETTTFTQPHPQVSYYFLISFLGFVNSISFYFSASLFLFIYFFQGPMNAGVNTSKENESSCNFSPASVHRINTPSVSTSSTSQPPNSLFTTKVTATAKFKVEVHTPVHSSFDRSHRHISRRRDSTSSTSTTSTECSMKLNS